MFTLSNYQIFRKSGEYQVKLHGQIVYRGINFKACDNWITRQHKAELGMIE